MRPVKRAAFAATLQRLQQRITRFVNLPLPSLDRLTLRQQLITIGASPSHPGDSAQRAGTEDGYWEAGAATE